MDNDDNSLSPEEQRDLLRIRGGGVAPGDPAEQQPAPATAPAAAAAPSIGQRILGAPAVAGQPAAPAQPAQDPTATSTRLANLGKAPEAPIMNPGFGAANEALRRDTNVTPKFDAAGKTLPQYKIGIGERIARGGLSFLAGGLPGVAMSIVDPAAKNYIGRGATNTQYERDEMARQNRLSSDQAKVASYQNEYNEAERGYKNKLEGYKDEVRSAAAQDVNAIRQQNADQKSDYENKMVDLRQQLADAKDPASRAKVEANTRAQVADQFKLTGKDRTAYILNGKLPDNELEALKLRVEMARLGMEMRKSAKADEEANEFGFTKNEERGINALAPGAQDNLRNLMKARADMVGFNQPTDKLDIEIDKATKALAAATEQVRSAKPAVKAKIGNAAQGKGGQPQKAAAVVYARDPKGVLHQAKSGTTLTADQVKAGWKMETRK